MKSTIKRGIGNVSSGAGESHDVLCSICCPFGELEDLDLEVDEEGLGPPPPNDSDGTIRYTGLVKCHGPTRTEQMGANVVRVEPQPAETDVCHPQADDSHNILDYEQPSKTAR